MVLRQSVLFLYTWKTPKERSKLSWLAHMKLQKCNLCNFILHWFCHFQLPLAFCCPSSRLPSSATSSSGQRSAIRVVSVTFWELTSPSPPTTSTRPGRLVRRLQKSIVVCDTGHFETAVFKLRFTKAVKLTPHSLLQLTGYLGRKAIQRVKEIHIGMRTAAAGTALRKWTYYTLQM